MEKINLWKDITKKVIDPELFSGTADRLAQQIAKEGSNKLIL